MQDTSWPACSHHTELIWSAQLFQRESVPSKQHRNDLHLLPIAHCYSQPIYNVACPCLRLVIKAHEPNADLRKSPDHNGLPSPPALVAFWVSCRPRYPSLTFSHAISSFYPKRRFAGRFPTSFLKNRCFFPWALAACRSQKKAWHYLFLSWLLSLRPSHLNLILLLLNESFILMSMEAVNVLQWIILNVCFGQCLYEQFYFFCFQKGESKFEQT